MKNIKVKPLTKSQILISIDRLTRFKNTETKYHRVFFDILTHNLLEPHLKKSDLECLPTSEIKSHVEHIINTSLEMLGISNDFDDSLNAKLREYEQSIFHFGHATLELLDNKINYKGCLSLIEDTAPQNLLWLKSLASVEDIKLERNKRSLKYPIEMVLLAEGATEEILLPEISKLYDFDFDKEGIYLYPAGGKNQVVKSYYELCEQLKIPIFVLLDKDGEENSKEIKRKLRQSDRIYLLECGEFEDLLQLDFIKRILTTEFKNISQFEQEIFNQNTSNVKLLEEIFKNRGMHEFKKVEFAQMVKQNLSETNDLQPETAIIIEVIQKIKNFPNN